MHLLINASNLRVGGGVAVAASFIADLSQCKVEASSSTVIVSTQVDANLMALGVRTESFHDYQVFDQFGIRALWHGLPVKLRDFDVVFTIFGPRYSFTRPKRSVTGLAQPWIVYPDNDIARGMSWLQRTLIRTKYQIQTWFFSREDIIIVEHEGIKQRLERFKPYRDIRIEVVQSEIGGIFDDPSKWSHVAFDPDPNYRVGVVSRNYPHKNLECLPEVKRILKSEFDLDVSIWVTFDHEEWSAVRQEFRDSINNIGVLGLAQVPSFMSQMDVIVLPTFLECFSAVPIQARALQVPIVASDRDFIRSTVSDYPMYVDPNDSGSIAKGISVVLSSAKLDRSSMPKRVKDKHIEKNRTRDYLRIIMEST